MPENVNFEQPLKEELITDPTLIDAARKGADVYCGYCGSRNPADAASCSTCGADLTEGTKRSAGQTYSGVTAPVGETIRCNVCGTENDIKNLSCISCGSSLQTTAEIETPGQAGNAVPVKGKGGKGCLIAFILLILAAILGMLFMTSKSESKSVVVSDTTWATSQEVLGLVERRASAWRDAVPSNGQIIQCSERVREKSDTYVSGSEEVCGQPYFVDRGNGFSEKVQDCYYQVYDDYCSYRYQGWDVISVLSDQGNDLNPVLPHTSLGNNQRLGSQSVSYTVKFTDASGQVYTYTPSSLEEYREFAVNDRYSLELNGFGSIVKMEKQ